MVLVEGFLPYETRFVVNDHYAMFAPGAFRSTIKRADTEVWISHDKRQRIARCCDGDVALVEDGGLLFAARVREPFDKSLVSLARLGQVHGVSLGWSTRYEYRTHSLGAVEVIDDVYVVEISVIVTDARPATPGTWARIYTDEEYQ